MKKNYILLLISLFLFSIGKAQQKPISLSLSSIKTEIEQSALKFGIKYLQELDSVFKQQDILLAQDNSLFQATPEFNIETGTGDAFSSITAKIKGLWMFFSDTTIHGLKTPNTKKLFHTLPLSAGLETDNTFNNINGIVEIGYVPWYQSPLNSKVPAFLKKSKVGIFLQGGYKFEVDDSTAIAVGGDVDESKEKPDEPIMRAKGDFSIDTGNLLGNALGWGVGIVAGGTGWYDFLNSETYYRLEGKLRFYLTDETFFDVEYQKGSGAPNFNEGDQYGAGLTVSF